MVSALSKLCRARRQYHSLTTLTLSTPRHAPRQRRPTTFEPRRCRHSAALAASAGCPPSCPVHAAAKQFYAMRSTARPRTPRLARHSRSRCGKWPRRRPGHRVISSSPVGAYVWLIPLRARRYRRQHAQRPPPPPLRCWRGPQQRAESPPRWRHACHNCCIDGL